jgi:hypothetical protein
MKKFIAISVVLVLLASVVYAQEDPAVSFNSWGRATLSLIQIANYGGKPYSDGDAFNGTLGTGAGTGVHWGDVYDEFHITVGTSAVGFLGTINFQGGLGVGDHLQLYAKPFDDFVTLRIGHYKDDELRGKIGDFASDLAWIVTAGNSLTGMYDGDAIFTRFGAGGTGGNDMSGALIKINPIENLTLAINLDPIDGSNFPAGGTPKRFAGDTKQSISTKNGLLDVFEKGQYAVGFNIDGVGLARVQYVGALNAYDAGSITAKRVEAAFAVLALDGIVIDLGAKIYLPFTGANPLESEATPGAIQGTVYQHNHAASVGAAVGLGDFGINARIDTTFGGSETPEVGSKTESGFTFYAYIQPFFNLGFATVGGDISFAMATESKFGGTGQKDSATAFGVGVWAKKAIGSNGYAKIALTGSFPLAYGDPDNGFQSPFVFTIPIVVETAF